jgi:hypothetical protein
MSTVQILISDDPLIGIPSLNAKMTGTLKGALAGC